MNFKAEVIADSSGKWVGNQLVFATKQEASDYVGDLMLRWTSVVDKRVVETDAEVSHRWIKGDYDADHNWVRGRAESVDVL
jgi:hypothetical protein